MNEKIYLHAINDDPFDKQILNFLDIVKDGEIQSLRNHGINESDSFAGLDYISLCDYEKRNYFPEKYTSYNSYYLYIKQALSFAFEKDKLDVIEPKYFELKYGKRMNDKLMTELGKREERYTDLMDEVQVKDRISLDKLSFVTFPTNWYFSTTISFTKRVKLHLLKERVHEVKSILKYFDYPTDVYDIDTGTKMDDEGIRYLIKQFYY